MTAKVVNLYIPEEVNALPYQAWKQKARKFDLAGLV